MCRKLLLKIVQKGIIVFVNTTNFCFQAYLAIRGMHSDEEVYNEISKIIGDSEHSPDDLRNTFRFLVSRLWAIYKYEPSRSFTNEIVLIRIKNYLSQFGSDYGLSKVENFLYCIKKKKITNINFQALINVHSVCLKQIDSHSFFLKKDRKLCLKSRYATFNVT